MFGKLRNDVDGTSVPKVVDEPETIGPILCSRWRPTPETLENRSASPTWHFAVVATTAIGLLIGLSKWALLLYAQGHIEAGTWVVRAIVAFLFVGVYGTPILVVITTKKRRRPDPPRPEGVPSNANHVVLRITSGDQGRGRSPGWIWFEGPWFRFEGDRFAFRLARRDVKSKRPSQRFRTGQSLRLNLPKELPETALRFYLRFPKADRLQGGSYEKERFLADADAWENAAEPREPSIFPPLRTEPSNYQEGFKTAPWLLISVVLSALICYTPTFLGTEQRPNPIVLSLGAFGFFATYFVLVPWTMKLGYRSIDRKVDRYAEKHRECDNASKRP